MALTSTRDLTKSILQKIGLFPYSRSLYRSLNARIRKQRAHETSFYSSIISPSQLCFDIGANLGQKTEIFLACGARVVSIEPNPLCYPTLKSLFGRNRKCEIVQSAVGRSTGLIDLYVHGTDATASVRAEWNKHVYGVDRRLRTVKVPVLTIDSLIERYGRPEFIKIDVEGFEADVLCGLSVRVPLISFEYHSSEIDQSIECLKILSRLGALSIRPADMDCNWLEPQTNDVATCLQRLQDKNVKGDLFVWIG